MFGEAAVARRGGAGCIWSMMSTGQQYPVSLETVRQAAGRFPSLVRHTPLLRSRSFDAQAGCQVYLKAENLQVTGSFKIRGAMNKMAALTPEARSRGVIAASMGNHAQGVAYAAREFGLAATILMPTLAPLSKIRATEGYGARVKLVGESIEECLAEAHRLAEQTGACLIHPFDDWDVIAGQGTLALEILADLPDADAVVVPIGGGGLLAGIAAKALRPGIRLIGVQAAGCASYAAALATGRPRALTTASTIADGIRVRQAGELTFPVIRDLVDQVLTVDDAATSLAIVQLLERRKLVVEGAGASSLAALFSGKHGLPPDAKVVAVLCGGNIDILLIGQIIEYSLAALGRLLGLQVTIPDTPGQLVRALQVMGELGANIVQIEHYRGEVSIPVGFTQVLIRLETRDLAHQEGLMAALEQRGFAVRRVGPAV
jgi:threonine dehydratase